jgi:tetratricopeptide (TPR) repeat protein
VSPERIADLEAAVAAMRLALEYRELERDEDAQAELEHVVAIRESALGPDHPDTLSARHQLALTYFHLSIGTSDAWLFDAIETMRGVGQGRLKVLGPAHPDTLATWASLALLVYQAGRFDEVGPLRERIAAGWEQVAADRDARLGPDEPDTQFARVELAAAYGDLGRNEESRAILEQVVASWGRLATERERRLGPVHPDTVYARQRHAYAHRSIGRSQDEVPLVEQIAADHERLLGPNHPRTLRAQIELVARYAEGDHDKPKAIALGERIIDDVDAVLGADHEDLRLLRAVLITSYRMAGRLDDALALAARYPIAEDD